MSILMITLLVLGSFAASYWLVGVVMRYALAAQVVDVPNDRTLHQGSVARGGGLAIVILVLITLGGAMLWWSTPEGSGWPLLLLILALGILGWIDDHYDLPVAVRIVAQFLVAGTFIAWVGPVTSVALGADWTIYTGAVAAPLSVIWLVWMTNLYNFMDGIDGVAALQGMIGSATLGLWFYWSGAAGLPAVCLVICGACGGFLVWNWAPARVFMGDVGSITLGGLFAALSVIAATRYDMPIIAFFILFIIFIGDATLTLLRRIVRREPFWRAHRSHFYQRAVRAGVSHSIVSIRMGGLAVIAASLATLVVRGLIEAWAGLAAALLLCAAAALAVTRRERMVQGAPGNNGDPG